MLSASECPEVNEALPLRGSQIRAVLPRADVLFQLTFTVFLPASHSPEGREVVEKMPFSFPHSQWS